MSLTRSIFQLRSLDGGLVRCIWRRFSGVSSTLEFAELGDPPQVVKKVEKVIPKLKENQVLVKMLAAPVNPADINTIQGVYGVKPELPCIPGSEGVGKIVDVGSAVTENLKVGDYIIPNSPGWGTWRDYAISTPQEIIKIPPDINVFTAATMTTIHCTAYRMLKDFVSLKEGDTVIQNGANSAVGQAIIQLASAYGVKTINVVRDRQSINELKEYLNKLGATVVVTEEELRKSEEVRALPKPKLALNCVSGRSGTEILKKLRSEGVMVTYGGMSRKPVTVPVGALIFSNVTLKGFWMTRWTKNHIDHPDRHKMLEELFNLMQQGKLHPPAHQAVPFEDYKTALVSTMSSGGMVGKKQILVFPPLSN